MDVRAFLRAIAVLALAIAATFAILLALPLPRGYFREWGLVTGPLAWILCSLLTSRLLDLSASRALTATVLSVAWRPPWWVSPSTTPSGSWAVSPCSGW